MPNQDSHYAPLTPTGPVSFERVVLFPYQYNSEPALSENTGTTGLFLLFLWKCNMKNAVFFWDDFEK